jgi:hypothetical protein
MDNLFSSPKNFDNIDTRKIRTSRAGQTYQLEQKEKKQHGQTKNRGKFCYQIKCLEIAHFRIPHQRQEYVDQSDRKSNIYSMSQQTSWWTI